MRRRRRIVVVRLSTTVASRPKEFRAYVANVSDVNQDDVSKIGRDSGEYSNVRSRVGSSSDIIGVAGSVLTRAFPFDVERQRTDLVRFGRCVELSVGLK